jgi:3-hydroxybutyrate dehydrogenase
MSSEKFLSGRVAMVTGGVSGMGCAMALAFASAGADIIVGSLMSSQANSLIDGEIVHTPDSASIDKLSDQCKEYGVRVKACHLDVCSQESVDSFYELAINEYTKVDILANAAGITAEQSIVGHPDSLWNKVMEVNINGTYRTIKACFGEMMERKWGRIINIASTAASVGAPTSAAYCASKAAVVALSRCVALEGASHGVTCNSISPGWVNTKFGNKWMKQCGESEKEGFGQEYIEEVKASNPQQRLIQPEEIGALALFLCKNEAQGMTMQDLTVSAGSLW